MNRLSKAEINKYAFYAFASNVGFAVPMGYITIFMTENLLISAAVMGTTLLIARAVDFVIALMAGGIVEKSRFKWGKYRSWLIILRYVIFSGMILQFINTSSLPMGVRVLVVILGYCMLHCSMNFIATAQFGILACMAGSSMEDRNQLAIRSGQMMAASMILTSATVLPFIQLITPFVGNSSAYLIATVLFGIVFIIGISMLIKTSEQYDLPQTKGPAAGMPTVTVSDMVKSVFTNSQLLVIMLANTLFNIGMMLMAGIMAYYFMYVLGNFLLMSVAMTSTTLFGLVASIIGPKIGLKLGKKNAMVAGLSVYTLGSLAITLFAKDSLVIYIIIGCVNSLAMYFYAGFGVNYFLDAGEYGFYKTGKDNRSVAMSMMNIPMKIGMALGGALAGYGLAIIGYTAGMTPTPEFIDKFMWLIGGIPAIFYALAALSMLVGYRITDADAAKYAAANAETMAKMMAERQKDMEPVISE